MSIQDVGGLTAPFLVVLIGSPSSVEGCFVVSGVNQPTLLTPFYSVLVSISVIMALSTVFHYINSPDNSPFSHSVLPVLGLLSPISLFLKVSLSSDMIPCG